MMNAPGGEEHTTGHRRRLAWIATGAAAILIPLAAVALYTNWLGMPFGERQLWWYLSSGNALRQRGALREAAARMARGDRRWDPQVIALARSGAAEVRESAARAMAIDPRNEPFRAALATLLEDISPMVRRSAAAALAASGDPRARPELRAMLHAYTVYSPYSGTLKVRVKDGGTVRPGTPVALVGQREIRSPLPGYIAHVYERDGAEIRTGQRVADIAPADQQIAEALKALAAAGDRYDAGEIQRFTAPGFPASVRSQAQAALAQLEARQPAQAPVTQ